MNKILSLCENQGFLKRTFNAILKQDCITVSPTGVLLQENLKNEWFNSTVINKDTTVVINRNNFNETLEYAKHLSSNILPFGVADVITDKKTIMEKYGETTDNECDFRKYFVAESDLIMKCFYFVPPKQSTQFFHQLQRQRRMWWRKFSANPGRYAFSDIQTGENSDQKVDIIADYEWGKQLLETISIEGTKHKNLEFKEGKITFQADCVSTEMYFSALFLNTLCDAYEEPLFQGNPRPLLHFHRKLAPYKVSFAITSPKASTTAELKDLALYLCRQLRGNNVSSLFLPMSYKLKLDLLWKQYDQLGVPYSIHLNDDTLKNGIAQLRSRDTTLKEQVHVSDIVGYVDKLFKNY